MKEFKKPLALMLAAMTASVFIGCGADPTFTYYQGETTDGATGKMEFSTDLFYRNDIKAAGNADPFVLDNTDVDGYYYMYATYGYIACHRSKDLVNWEPTGPSLNAWQHGSEGNKVAKEGIWAPEVVRDDENDRYVMHFSATPENNKGVKWMLMAAVSDSPTGPFDIVNFVDPESCGEENVHDYDTDVYTDWFAEYFFLDPELFNDFADEWGGRDLGNGGYTGAIDPHAFVDADGTKYLYFVDNQGENFIVGCEMENWLKPKWETMTVLTAARYYTVEDWRNEKFDNIGPGENGDDYVSYETANNIINEGPTMTEHNGKYYLTLSVNDYSLSNYAVCQAVADSPLGAFRKLRDEENGLLLSSLAEGSKEVSGSGHHSFVTVDGDMYIIYHRHDDFTTAGSSRNPGIDEIKWVTITDINGEALDVMYANGPTWNVQPNIIGKYKNIAGDATVTGSADAEYLTDGLLSVCKTDNDFQFDYIGETMIDETTTFTFDFGKARKIRAVMIYESKYEDCAFKTATVELVTASGVTHRLELKLARELYEEDDYYFDISYISPGASVFAEFAETEVTKVRVTVPVKNEGASAGISEIRILGIAEGK